MAGVPVPNPEKETICEQESRLPLSFELLLDILGVAIVLLMNFINVVCKQRLLSNVKKMFCFLPSFILTPFQYICYLNNSFPNLFYFAFRLEVALGVVWIFSTT